MKKNHRIESPYPKQSMTLIKAIEIGTIYRKQFHLNTDFDYAQAISLLIEAGKGIKVYRSANESWLSLPLPGETKEEVRGVNKWANR